MLMLAQRWANNSSPSNFLPTHVDVGPMLALHTGSTPNETINQQYNHLPTLAQYSHAIWVKPWKVSTFLISTTHRVDQISSALKHILQCAIQYDENYLLILIFLTLWILDYVASWCKSNGFEKPSEQQVHDAITERMSVENNTI